MDRRDWIWLGLALILLIGGLLLGRRLSSAQPGAGELTEAMAFRQWLWESRSLDLTIQVGLILTGALAIAALLPRPGETENGAAPGGGPQDKAR